MDSWTPCFFVPSAFVFIWIEMEYLSNMKTGGKTLLVLYFMNLVWCTQFDNFLLEVCDAFCYVRSFILSSLGFQQFFLRLGTLTKTQHHRQCQAILFLLLIFNFIIHALIVTFLCNLWILTIATGM